MLDLCEQGTPVGVVVIDGAGCVIGFADGLRRVVIKRFAVSLTLTKVLHCCLLPTTPFIGWCR